MHPSRCSKDASRDTRQVGLTPISGVDVAAHGIDIDAVAYKNTFLHINRRCG